MWNFDSDKAGEVPAGWKAIEGDWQVIPDPSAPSKPNTFGLPAGRLLKSLTNALEYYPLAIETDPTEYSDFTLEAQFKSAGGRFDCSGGLIFRYVDEKNFYLLSAGCPSDYFALSRMTNGQLVGLKQSVVPTDKDTWYRLKVTAQGGHFSCYDDDKMIFDFDDSKIAKGKIGVWARDDSQAQFDDVKLTVIAPGENPRRSRAGCVRVAVVSTMLAGRPRDGVACGRLATYSGCRWKPLKKKRAVDVRIEPLRGLPLILEVVGGVGRTLGLTLLVGSRDRARFLLPPVGSSQRTPAPQARERVSPGPAEEATHDARALTSVVLTSPCPRRGRSKAA